MNNARAIRHLAACIVAIFAAHLSFTACGGNGAGVDGSAAGAGTDGGGGGSGECTNVGVSCTSSDDCCTGFCDPSANVCSRGSDACLEGGQACDVGPDCCSYSCVGGSCSDSQCTTDGEACAGHDECCGGTCESGTCTALSDSCKTSGNSCSDHGDCCSSYCSDGLCTTPSYCTQSGDVCTTDAECCAGLCNKEDGSQLGLCALAPASGAGGCLSAGEVCSGGATYEGGDLPTCGGECRSRACFPYGPTGVLICQPPSGCRPTGEICREDGDCCGSAALPDGETANIKCSKEEGLELGRCDAGNSCTPAGGICRLQEIECSANANCCSGNVLQENSCKQDNLGIPRCLAAGVDCTDPQSYMGEACASSADCCGLPCVPNPEGDPSFVCGGACVEDGGGCTTTSDCCSGLNCNIATGSTSGTCGTSEETCAEYGQECSESSDCCNDVPCTNGSCVVLVK